MELVYPQIGYMKSEMVLGVGEIMNYNTIGNKIQV